jgi:hypothetical protein
MSEGNTQWGFDMLPKEIKQLIFSFTELDLPTVLRAQSASSEFKRLCWSWLRDYDTSLFIPKERTPVVAAYFINRVNPNIIRFIDFSQFDDPINSSNKIIKKFPKLQRIEFGLQDASRMSGLLLECERHPQLREVSYSMYNKHYVPEILSIRQDVRVSKQIMHWGLSRYQWANQPLFNHSTVDTPFIQQNPIAFHRTYSRGGIIAEMMMVIGATDGTLTFLTLDDTNNRLTIHSTKKDLHKGAINAIWCEKDFTGGVFSPACIASSDGIVTSWICTNDAPELKQTFALPESILFVCDFASNYLLAAGKRTLYICDIQTAKIIRKIAVDEDITGLSNSAKTGQATLSTTNRLYAVNENVSSAEGLQHLFDVPFPNLCISPDGSLIAVVLPDDINLYDGEGNTDESCDAYVGRYDTRPHLMKFCPSRYWLTASHGTSLTTFDIQNKFSYYFVSPRISRSEIAAGAFPTCNSLWYSTCGNYLFGLFSNDTLYWWHILSY